MDFATLTDEQKSVLTAFTRDQFRPSVGSAARALNGLSTLLMLYKTSGVEALVATLSPGDPIPDSTGLAGAQSITAADVQSFMVAADGLLATYNTLELRTEYAKIAGVSNTV